MKPSNHGKLHVFLDYVRMIIPERRQWQCLSSLAKKSAEHFLQKSKRKTIQPVTYAFIRYQYHVKEYSRGGKIYHLAHSGRVEFWVHKRT